MLAFKMCSWAKLRHLWHRLAATRIRHPLIVAVFCCLVVIAVSAVKPRFPPGFSISTYSHSGGFTRFEDIDNTIDNTIDRPTLSAVLSNALGSQTLLQVDWSRFAYYQHVTNLTYLCGALQLFSRLEELGCPADRVLSHPMPGVALATRKRAACCSKPRKHTA
jgi:hypothetical protein